MDLRTYFEEKRGRGVLATADREGRVDVAVYARPHVLEDGGLAFIMGDRLTHHNLLSNPFAAYLFMEEGPGYTGVRLFLRKTGEDKDSPLIASLRRHGRHGAEGEEEGPARFLVLFTVERILPLVGPA